MGLNCDVTRETGVRSTQLQPVKEREKLLLTEMGLVPIILKEGGSTHSPSPIFLELLVGTGEQKLDIFTSSYKPRSVLRGMRFTTRLTGTCSSF